MSSPRHLSASVFEICVFFLVLWTGFQTIFSLSAYPTAWINAAIVALQHSLNADLSDSFWASLLIDGLLGGVGATLVFMPQILLLFLFLELIRDSGYLRKNSHLLEKTLRRVGLGSESLPPLLMGFGCNVPAIMALKNLDAIREKVITAMMIPFMSCSARLPVYTLLTAAFFPERWQGTVLFAIYLTGVCIAALTGLVLHRFLKAPALATRHTTDLRLRLPRPKHIVRAAARVTLDFFWRIGRIIVPASIVMWALFAYPAVPQGEPLTGTIGGQIGQAIAPVFAPLGFDWRISVALLTGVVAKETIISTMGVFLSLKHNETILSVTEMLRNPEVLSLPAALALLVFVLLYIPCVGVFAAIKHEVGLKWALVALVYPTALAWVLAFFTYRVGLFFA